MTFPVLTELTFRGMKAIEYMRRKQYKIRAFNIVYFEGLDPDLRTANSDRIDYWNVSPILVTC